MGPDLPGEQLARDLMLALEGTGYSSLEVVNEEPFWVIRIPADPKPIDVDVGLFLPAEIREKAIWWVSVPSRLGGFARLLGKPEDPQIIELLEALHTVLQTHPNIVDVRWFKKLPAEPYRSSKFANHPIANT